MRYIDSLYIMKQISKKDTVSFFNDMGVIVYPYFPLCPCYNRRSCFCDYTSIFSDKNKRAIKNII